MNTALRIILVALAASIIASSAAVAYYVTPYSRGYVTYPTYRTGYGSYAAYDGNWGLVSPGPYPYASNARYVQEATFQGHYSRYTNTYHNGYTGAAVPQVWRGYTVPPRSYPYAIQGVHRE